MMTNNSRIEPAEVNVNRNANPSAPPLIAPVQPPPYNPNYLMSSPASQVSPLPQHQGKGMLNPMMYTVPGTLHLQPTPVHLLPPNSSITMPQPLPAPGLHEVSLNEERQRVRCPYCYASITTKISYRIGTMVHIAAMAVLVVFFPCFWVPYIMDCCKDVDHSCPSCGRSIGRFKRFT